MIRSMRETLIRFYKPIVCSILPLVILCHGAAHHPAWPWFNLVASIALLPNLLLFWILPDPPQFRSDLRREVSMKREAMARAQSLVNGGAND